MFKYFLYKFGQFCVTRLPVKLAYTLACFVSDCHYYLSFRDRQNVKNNLKIILNRDTDLEKPAKEVFRNFGKYLVEFFRMAHTTDDAFIRDQVKLVNIKYLDQALEKGRGAIICSAHIGNWELGGVILGKLGYPSIAVALPHKERPVNDLFNKQRESRGVTVVPISSAVRRCLEALKSNKLIAVIADRDFTANGFVVNFLNRPTLIPKGPAIFAAKSGAPIVPTFLYRNDDQTFTLELGEPIYAQQTVEGQVEKSALIPIMQRYAEVIEKKVQELPTQWLMFRPYWFDEKAGHPEPIRAT